MRRDGREEREKDEDKERRTGRRGEGRR